MQIKEVAAICGLTEKAIRLYEEKGLITPTITEKNGRNFRDYDEATVKQLKTIAGLRQSFFSIEQIAAMQNAPGDIPAIFAEYRAGLNEKCAELETLLSRADSVTQEALVSADALAGALTGLAAPAKEETPMLSAVSDTESAPAATAVPETPTPKISTPKISDEEKTDPQPAKDVRVWDEEPDYSEAYRRYIRAWEARYEQELWWGKVRRRVLIPAAAAVLVLLGLYNIPLVKEVDVTYHGYEITYAGEVWQEVGAILALSDAEDGNPLTADVLTAGVSDFPQPCESRPVTIRLRGMVYRYLFREDFYRGSVETDAYAMPYVGPAPAAELSDEDVRLGWNVFRIPENAFGILTPESRMMRPQNPDTGDEWLFSCMRGTFGGGDEVLVFSVGGISMDLDILTPAVTDENTFLVLGTDVNDPADASYGFWDVLWREMQRAYKTTTHHSAGKEPT